MITACSDTAVDLGAKKKNLQILLLFSSKYKHANLIALLDKLDIFQKKEIAKVLQIIV